MAFKPNSPITINAASFGFLPSKSGVENDAAMRKILASVTAFTAGLSIIAIPSGAYNCTLATPWPGIANCVIQCDPNAVLTRTDATANNWWEYTNLDNFSVMGYGTWIGNSVATGSANGNFVLATLDGSTVIADMIAGQFQVKLENFKGDNWMFFQLSSAVACNFDFKWGRIWDYCSFTSRTGNCRGPTNPGIPSFAVSLVGPSNGTGTGRVRDWHIGNVTGDIPDIKGLIRIWQGVEKVFIDSPYCSANGAIGISQSAGSYGILIGNEDSGGLGATDPDLIFVRAPVFLASYDAAIYFVTAGSGTTGGTGRYFIDLAGGQISGQTDPDSGTIFKGGIASSGIGKLTVTNLTIDSCLNGLDLAMGPNDTLTVDGGNITNFVTNGIRITNQCSSGHSTGPVSISLNTIISTQTNTVGIVFVEPAAGASYGVTTVDAEQVSVTGLGIDIRCASPHAAFTSFSWSCKDMRNSRFGYFLATSNTGPISWDGVYMFRGTTAGAYNPRIGVEGCTDLHIGATFIDDVRSGDAAAFDGSTDGTSVAIGVFTSPTAIQYTNTTVSPERRAVASGLGSQKPSAPSQDGAINQNLIAPAPSAGSYPAYWVRLGGSWLTASIAVA